MMTRRSWVLGMVLAVGVALGCDESPTEPEVPGGAGIRILLPAGTDTLAWLRVELWHDNDVVPLQCNTVLAPEGARLPATLAVFLSFCG